MVLFTFSPQRVLQALLIKHTSYSAAMICRSLWVVRSWAKWTPASHWKAPTDRAAVCTTRRLECFSWWPGSWAGDDMTWLNLKGKRKVRLAGASQGENRRGSKERRYARKAHPKVWKLQRSSVKYPEISKGCFVMDFTSELYGRNPTLQH